jgi:hypothetical protein
MWNRGPFGDRPSGNETKQRKALFNFAALLAQFVPYKM